MSHCHRYIIHNRNTRNYENDNACDNKRTIVLTITFLLGSGLLGAKSGHKREIAHFVCFVQFFIGKSVTIEKCDNTITNFTLVRNKGYSERKNVFTVPFNLHYRHTREEIYEQINRFAALLPHISGMPSKV